MQLSSSDLALLRQRPHKTNLYLSIYRPKTLMSAQVASGTYNVGDIQIPYYNVSTGSYLNLYSDLTVLVGTNQGDDDYGRIRMRSATGTYAIFAENAINWNVNQYLTFIDQIDIQAIYPRIIQDPNNETNVIFYKDYNIPYSNQNQIYGTFINAGPHRAGFISSGTFFFSATGSYNVNSESLTWSWIFEGGNPTGSTAFTPGLVKWNTPGHYKVRIRSTSSSGAVDDTYRYVSMYDRPGEGANPPISRWELKSLSGSRSEGGYTASFKVYENIGSVQPNAIVVMFGETVYGNTNKNIGGNSINNSGIYFVGYIIGDSIKFDYQSSSVEFSVGSVTEIMKNAEGFSVSCESKASPTTWFELYEMTVQRAIYHYLRWHSTVLKVTDFQYIGDNRLVQYFDADRGSLYDAIDSFVRDGLLGETIADRQGKIWSEISSFGLETPFSNIPTTMNFYKQDWINDPTVDERRNSDLSFIELGGIAYYGVSSNTFSALLSNAPSTAPLYHGKGDRKEGLILASQAQLNQVSGNYLAHYNSKYPNVQMSLAGCYLNLDIAPQEKSFLLVSPSDTILNKSLQNFPYIVSSMDWKYSSVQESFHPDVSLLQIATGTAGVSVQIPPTPPDNGYSYPSLNLPPLPDFPSSSGVGSTIPSVVLLKEATTGVLYTKNFDSTNPQWFTMNNGLTVTQYQNINFLFLCPNGVVYCGRGVSGSTAFLARAPYVGGTWTIIEDTTTLAVKYPGGSTTGICCIVGNPSVPEQVFYLGGTNALKNPYLASGGTTTQGSATITNMLNADGVGAYGVDGWQLTGPQQLSGFAPHLWLVSKDGSSVLFDQDSTVVLANSGARIFSGWATKTTFILAKVNGFYKYTDSLQDTTPYHVSGSFNFMKGFSVDSYAVNGMADWDVGLKGRSSDTGTTWTPLPNLPPSSSYLFAYAGNLGGSTSGWIAVGSGAVIRFSPDFGNTWLNREGNITSIIPVPSVNVLCVQGVAPSY